MKEVIMLTLNKTLLSVSLAFALAGTAFAQPMDQEAKESYSLGASVGNYLSSQIYKQTELGASVNMDQVMAGLQDAMKNKSKLSEDEMLQALNTRAEKLNKLFTDKLNKIKETNRKASSDYLETNKSRKGVKVTASGLQYEVQKEGAGPQPKEEDIVTVDYSGRLIDGKVFTSPDGKVREEKFVMMTLIPALKEGLTMMKEGSSYTFVVPASLAYGEEGAGDIPPESALIFDVTLKKVEKPGANKDAAMPAGHPKMAWPHG